MNNTYQLSQSGIERLERFKCDIEAGDFEVSETILDGEQFDWILSAPNGIATVYCFDDSDPVKAAVRKINNTLSNGIKKSYMSHDRSWYFYCSTSDRGDAVALHRNDITTPAQRALETLGKKLQDRSNYNA